MKHTKTSPVNFESLHPVPFDLEKTSSKMLLSQVFAEKSPLVYLNEFTLFVAHFNSIPNYIEEENIDCEGANRWLLNNYSSDIRDCYYNKRYLRNNKSAELDDIYYLLFDDLLIYFDTNCSDVRFLFRKTATSKIDAVIADIKKFKKRKSRRKPTISLIVSSRHGLETKSMKIDKPKLSIEDNYNDDFKDVHQTILKRLMKRNDKGLVLLHGKPGTGKTSYIRYLVATLKKEVIFLPPNLASIITDPGLMNLLMYNQNCVFVIEDAENIIVDRGQEGNSPVSALLNISDGLLSDCLNIQIICSFNTDISKVDSALMRKGRLIAKYEFKELQVEKARQLSKKLGFDTSINKPMSLTSIYNQDEKEFQQPEKSNPIGFHATNKNRLAEN